MLDRIRVLPILIISASLLLGVKVDDVWQSAGQLGFSAASAQEKTTTSAATAGLDHLGIEVESSEELAEVSGRMDTAGEVFDQGETTCCYSESEKAWVHDPTGIAWEAFHTTGESTRYGAEAEATEARIAGKAPAATLPVIEDTSGACCPPEKE